MLFTAFCVYGLIASGEPGPNHVYFRVGYAVFGFVSAAVAIAMLAVGKKPA
jgi:hypothetical protein